MGYVAVSGTGIEEKDLQTLKQQILDNWPEADSGPVAQRDDTTGHVTMMIPEQQFALEDRIINKQDAYIEHKQDELPYGRVQSV